MYYYRKIINKKIEQIENTILGGCYFMKAKKIVIFIFMIIMLVVMGGCKSNTQDTSSKESTSPKTEEITSPTDLEKLWEEYLYYTIATVGNDGEFSSSKEIDPVNVARYCWQQYMAEHGKENKLESLSKGSTFKVFPMDIVLNYSNRYFNLDSIDVSKVSGELYDKNRCGFILGEASEEKIPHYTDKNYFCMQLDKVTISEDDTITAVIVQYDTYATKRIEAKRTYKLKKRQDGSLYFLSCSIEYINNKLVTLNGDYKRFDKISGYDGGMDQLSMIGEIEGRLVLAQMPYDEEKTASIMLVNPDTLTVEEKLELNKKFAGCYFKMIEDNIYVCLKDKVVVIDKTLKQVENIQLPKVIIDKIKRKPKYDSNGLDDIYFGGYDISKDRTNFVYSDEVGVKLFDVKSKREKLLCKTIVNDTNKVWEKHSYHLSPRFVSDDKKIMTSILGYEGIVDCNICDIENNVSKKLDIRADISTETIHYDTGVLGVNAYISNEKGCKTLYYNFKTDVVTEIKLEDTGDTGYIRDIDQCYVGSNYAAFITQIWDGKDNANSMFYINQLNLKTFKLEPKIISVKAGQTHILGVLKDGRIVFWYNYCPSEKGFCITK